MFTVLTEKTVKQVFAAFCLCGTAFAGLFHLPD